MREVQVEPPYKALDPARLAPGAEARGGEHIVSAVEGNWLILTPAASA